MGNFKFYRKTLIISIIIFIVVSISYFYTADLAMRKFDEKLGINPEMINVSVIAKNYDLKHNNPVLTVVYTTERKTTSYLKVDDIRSESSYGKNFTKRLILDNSYSGKNVSFTIVAIDDYGKEKTFVKEVSLPDKVEEPIIRISG